jgi:hypothetical protein
MAAALLLSVPVALRGVWGSPARASAEALVRPLAEFCLLLAAATLVVVPVGLWLRQAALKDASSLDRALLLGAGLSALPLALFGGVLKSTTHHRPLGGATFAVVACVVLALCIGLAFRIGSAAKLLWLQRFFSACSGLSLLATIALVAGRPALLLDFLALGAACAGAGLLKLPAALARMPRALPVGLWALLLAGGLFLRSDPQLIRNLQNRAPISFAALSWLGDGS